MLSVLSSSRYKLCTPCVLTVAVNALYDVCCGSMALGGRFIPINGVASDPQVLNHWLQKNNGYVYEDELEEVPQLPVSCLLRHT